MWLESLEERRYPLLGTISKMLDTLPVTHRQKLISTMLTRGMSTVAIAHRIGVPIATVRTDRLVLSAVNPEEVRKHSPEKFGAQRPVIWSPSKMPLEERRQAVAKLHQQGLSDAAIARTLNVGCSTVGKDREQMGMVLEPVEHTIQERRARVKVMIDDERSCKEIEMELGVTKMTVIRDRAALGYSPWREDREQEITARRAQVKEMVAAGQPSKIIAEALGVNTMTISRDCEALGISPPQNKESIARSVAERRSAVRDEYERGTAIKEIAAKLGVNHMTVRRDIELLGD